MKNKIKFSEKNEIQERQFLDQKETESIGEQKSDRKPFHKIIKGKVKVYHNNHKPNFWCHKHNYNDESELILISDRMLLFMKFVFVVIVLFFLFLIFKNNPIVI